jgi:hypothetical protein
VTRLCFASLIWQIRVAGLASATATLVQVSLTAADLLGCGIGILPLPVFEMNQKLVWFADNVKAIAVPRLLNLRLLCRPCAAPLLASIARFKSTLQLLRLLRLSSHWREKARPHDEPGPRVLASNTNCRTKLPSL